MKKVLKVILIVLVVIIAVPLIAALFVKKDYQIERQVTINKPKQEVFEYIKYLKNQDYYSKWNNMDPAMKKTYKGTDGAEGFVYGWESEKKDVGKGEQEIKKIIPGERVDLEVRFIEPWQSTDVSWIATEEAPNNQTLVKWGIKGRMAYPMNLMLLCFNMEKEIGGDLQTGLNNLKTVLEK